ncbi:hypothetical protein Ahy_A08g040191 isoform C [Arachis hypogaea]|uniref:Transmembrane protein n=1 Tax=Arachis hypogaea TaxID=3818 RepID=A0A445BYF7_ARAHY|nr:hypothetical protein Ahy_A08g040191 isoform C [Arachis hypogaea]
MGWSSTRRRPLKSDEKPLNRSRTVRSDRTGTRPEPHNPSQKSYTRPPQGVAYCRRPSLKVRHPSVYLASLVLQVFNTCSLSPIAAASSSSAFVVFVCSAALPSLFVCRSRSRLRSAVVFVRVIRRSRSIGVHCSRSLAVHHSSSHSRCSASNSATNPRAPPSRRTALFCRRRT